MLHMEVESVYTSDGGKRPPSYLILGVVNALEPKLAQLMFPFSKLNVDADNLVEVLDLHFDPEMALGNRIIPPVESENNSDEENLLAPGEEQQFPDMSRLESFDSPSNENDLGESADETLMVTDGLKESNQTPTDASFDGISAVSEFSVQEEDSLSNMNISELSTEENSLSDMTFSGLSTEQNTRLQEENQSPESSEEDVMDAFGDISFDDAEDLTVSSLNSNDSQESNNSNSATAPAPSDREMLGDMDLSNDEEDNGFGNVLMDVWGEESSVPDSEANLEALNGEEKSADSAFDDTDIARLFPNS